LAPGAAYKEQPSGGLINHPRAGKLFETREGSPARPKSTLGVLWIKRTNTGGTETMSTRGKKSKKLKLWRDREKQLQAPDSRRIKRDAPPGKE